MQRTNHQLEMEKALRGIEPGTPLLLHACCAPCSSAVLERLVRQFAVTLFYYNPNIWPQSEYQRRRDEAKKLLAAFSLSEAPQETVHFLEGVFDEAAFAQAARGLEGEPEGGARCAACFRLRLEETAQMAARGGFPWFTTTLTISPHKNAALLNELGGAAAQKYGVRFLPSDFKKREGYKRSIELSKLYGLYRQEYCGCRFSAEARERAVRGKDEGGEMEGGR